MLALVTIDAPTATIIVALIVAAASIWQSFMLSKVHTLVNSNFTEAKQARAVAEAALKTAQELAQHLQRELDVQVKAVKIGPIGDTGPMGPTGATGETGKPGPPGKPA